MAGVVPGRSVPVQRSVLSRGAGRPVAVQREGVQRRVPFPSVVVRRMDGSVGRRPAADRQQPAGVPAIYAYRSVLAGTVGKSVRQVSITNAIKIIFVLYARVCIYIMCVRIFFTVKYLIRARYLYAADARYLSISYVHRRFLKVYPSRRLYAFREDRKIFASRTETDA